MAKSNVWQWSETPANNTEIDGIDITGTTGKVKDGDNAIREMMAQLIEMEGKGVDIASAATLSLSVERYYHVTGTTTITDIDFTDAVDGRWAWLIFDGALTLTHNGTTLVLPGSANIVTTSGDRALFVQDNADNVVCMAYVPSAAVPNTQNGQYKFPATQNASTDANTLDDYEEGTWTPSIGGTTTYTARSGAYLKIGKLVKIQGLLAINAASGGFTSYEVAGLPFTTANTTNVGTVTIGYFTGSAASWVYLSGTFTPNATTIGIRGLTAAAASMGIAFGAIDSGTHIYFSGSYIATT